MKKIEKLYEDLSYECKKKIFDIVYNSCPSDHGMPDEDVRCVLKGCYTNAECFECWMGEVEDEEH